MNTKFISIASIFIILSFVLLCSGCAVFQKTKAEDITAIVISAIALSISASFGAYTLITQRRQNENSNWNMALSRVGQLFDQATENEELANIIFEPVDLEGKELTGKSKLTSKEVMWMSNLFMALEQVYVTVSAAGAESKRAWKEFITDSLNKPTIRYALIDEMLSGNAYHRDFVKFTCGDTRIENSVKKYSGGVIKKEAIESILSKLDWYTGKKFPRRYHSSA